MYHIIDSISVNAISCEECNRPNTECNNGICSSNKFESILISEVVAIDSFGSVLEANCIKEYISNTASNYIKGQIPIIEFAQNLTTSLDASKNKTITLCMSQNGGFLSIGEINTLAHFKEMKYTPMLSLVLSKLDISNKTKDIQDYVTIDSTSVYSYFSSDTFNFLVNALKVNKSLEKFNEEFCYLTNTKEEALQLLSQLPDIILVFGNNNISYEWRANSYTFIGSNKLCLSFKENTEKATILGISWMLNHDIAFNFADKTIGMALSYCGHFNYNSKKVITNNDTFHVSLLKYFYSYKFSDSMIISVKNNTIQGQKGVLGKITDEINEYQDDKNCTVNTYNIDLELDLKKIQLFFIASFFILLISIMAFIRCKKGKDFCGIKGALSKDQSFRQVSSSN